MSNTNQLETIQTDQLVLGHYAIKSGGIFRYNEMPSDDGKETQSELICLTPMYPTAIIENIDTKEQRIELTYAGQNHTETVILDRETLVNKNKVVGLARYGIAVGPVNASKVWCRTRYEESRGEVEQENGKERNMSEVRLIDANALKDAHIECPDNISFFDFGEIVERFLQTVDEQPTVDAVPVRHGKWIYTTLKRYKEYTVTCPFCGAKYHDCYDGYIDVDDFNYCPNCGAKMDGADEERR